MITVKYEKRGDAIYMSHIDLVRAMQRTLRRADIRTETSEGFNPHPITFFGQPLPLGVESLAEYFVFAEKEGSASDAFERFAAASTENLRCVRFWKTDKNPNLAGKVTACDYVAEVLSTTNKTQESLFEICKNEFEGKVHGLSVEGVKLLMRIGVGNNNLKPQKLLEFISVSTGMRFGRITRLSQLVAEKDGSFTDADVYLKRTE